VDTSPAETEVEVLSGEAGGGYSYPDSEDELDYDDDPECSHCGGYQWTDCDDPIQCTYARCDGETHRCPACYGTGLAKHQWLW